MIIPNPYLPGPGRPPYLPPPAWEEKNGILLPSREQGTIVDCGGSHSLLGGRRRATGGGGPAIPAGASLVIDHWDPSTMKQSTGGAAVANGNQVGYLADTKSGGGRSWANAATNQRPVFTSSAFGGKGGLVYDGNDDLLTGNTTSPPTGPCTYVHTWQLSSVPTTSQAFVVLTEANGTIASSFFLTNLSGYRPFAFAAGYTGAVGPVGLNTAPTTDVTTFAWAYLGGGPTTPANYRAVLNGVDVTSSILAGSGGVDPAAANNCFGAYNSTGVSVFKGSMYKTRRWDTALSVAQMIQACAEAVY